MADFAASSRGTGRRTTTRWQTQAARSFARFWNADGNYCYDVIDGPEGDDASLRPNQLFAVSLPHSPLNTAAGQAVVDACALDLLTSHGLRSLAPEHPAYLGHYGGDRRQRDGAYHQGTVWGWLIGPFAVAHLRVYGDPARRAVFLPPAAPAPGRPRPGQPQRDLRRRRAFHAARLHCPGLERGRGAAYLV